MLTLIGDRLLIEGLAILLSLCAGSLLARVTGMFFLGRKLHRLTAVMLHRANRADRPEITRAMRGMWLLCAFILCGALMGSALDMITHQALHVAILSAMLQADLLWLPLIFMARAGDKQQWHRLDSYLKWLAPGCHAVDGHGKLRLAIWLTATRWVQIHALLLAWLLGGFSAMLALGAALLFAQHAPHHLASWRAFSLVSYWLLRPCLWMSGLPAQAVLLLVSMLHPGMKHGVAFITKPTLYGLVARLLDVTLGGQARAYSHALPDAWVGNGTAKLEALHARRAASLFATSGTLLSLLALTTII